VDEHDLRVRNWTYHRFVETGRAPRVEDVAEAVGISQEDAAAAWHCLHDGHALVLEQNALELRMLNPFSCIPSGDRVAAAGRKWYSNCAWDSFADFGWLRERVRRPGGDPVGQSVRGVPFALGRR